MTKKYWGARGKQRGNPDGFVHTQINFYNRKELHFLFFTEFVYSSVC